MIIYIDADKRPAVGRVPPMTGTSMNYDLSMAFTIPPQQSPCPDRRRRYAGGRRTKWTEEDAKWIFDDTPNCERSTKDRDVNAAHLADDGPNLQPHCP